VPKFKPPTEQSQFRRVDKFNGHGASPTAIDALSNAVDVYAVLGYNAHQRIGIAYFDLKFLDPADPVEQVLDVMSSKSMAADFNHFVRSPDYFIQNESAGGLAEDS
jgi:hypothetical protein